MHVTDYTSVDNLRCHVHFKMPFLHLSSLFLPLLSAGGIKSRLLTSDPACWSFIMQMMDKFEIYHTEHSVSDIYEWEDTAGE